MRLIIGYITNPNEEEAKKIAKHLLEKKLIACANIFPIKSMYYFKGKFNDDDEFVLVAKTTKEKFEDMKKEVEKIHSYTVPCILGIEVNANKKYEEWVINEVQNK